LVNQYYSDFCCDIIVKLSHLFDTLIVEICFCLYYF